MKILVPQPLRFMLSHCGNSGIRGSAWGKETNPAKTAMATGLRLVSNLLETGTITLRDLKALRNA
jgi:hypothetical protein